MRDIKDRVFELKESRRFCSINKITTRIFETEHSGRRLSSLLNDPDLATFYVALPEEDSEIIAFGVVQDISVDDYNALQKLELPQPAQDIKYSGSTLPDFFSYISFPWHSSEDSLFSRWVMPVSVIRREGSKYHLRLNMPEGDETIPEFIYNFFTASDFDNHFSPRIKQQIFVEGINDESYEIFASKISQMKDEIAAGNISKGVISRVRRIKFVGDFDFEAAVSSLALSYPECTIILTNYSGRYFLCATPEKLFKLQNGKLTAEALAGSIRSSEKPRLQDTLEDELLGSSKNLLEHMIVRDFIVSNLSKISDDIRYDEMPSTKRLSNVTHLRTPVTAIVDKEMVPLVPLNLLFPTPALCGEPKMEAARIINKIEGKPRDLYGGVLGYTSTGGVTEFFVSIRCGYIDEGSATLYAGGGIVGESDPQSEYSETELKFIPLTALFLDENQS